MLNALQRHLLDGTFSFVFETLTEDVTPEVGLLALTAMKDTSVYKAQKQLFETQNLVDMIDQVRAIYAHPCPQNRSTGAFQVSLLGREVAWRSADGRVCTEQRGLLGLTAQGDSTTPAVTKQDVVNYLDGQLAHYHEQLAARQQEVEQEAVVAAQPERSFKGLFAYIQATVGFYDAFSYTLMDYPELDRQAAATYMTTVLNAIRKEVLSDFYKDPSLFAMPKELIPFIKGYVEQHPILLEANTYAAHTKTLEKQYLLQGCADLTAFSEVTDNPNRFFASKPELATSAITQKTLQQAVNTMVQSLRAVLAQTALAKSAPESYVASILAASRKNQLDILLDAPVQYGIADEFKQLINELVKDNPVILQASTLGAEAKELETALMHQASALQQLTQPSEPATRCLTM
jgi:hypothetical protein